MRIYRISPISPLLFYNDDMCFVTISQILFSLNFNIPQFSTFNTSQNKLKLSAILMRGDIYNQGSSFKTNVLFKAS